MSKLDREIAKAKQGEREITSARCKALVDVQGYSARKARLAHLREQQRALRREIADMQKER